MSFFMLDPRWENDTLFLIVEEDFRFRESEAPGRRQRRSSPTNSTTRRPQVARGSSGGPDTKVRHKMPL